MRKKIFLCLFLALMLCNTFAWAAGSDLIDPESGLPAGSVTDTPQGTQPVGEAAKVTATPTTNIVTLDGKTVTPEGYNIGGFNYFKLRDMAYLLKGSSVQFDVGYDDVNKAISLITDEPYTVTGGELSGKATSKQTAVLSTMKVLCDGNPVSIEAYNIRGNTYYKLRDLADVIGFSVDFDEKTQTAILKTPVVETEPEEPVDEDTGPDTDEPTGEDTEEPDQQNHAIDGQLTILIDVGHGGSDGGSDGIASQDFTNYRGETVKAGETIYEKDFNLPVALRLRDLLEEAGATVYMTREDDSYLSASDRKEIIEKYADKLDLCISVHHNAFNGVAAGAEVWAQIKYEDGGAGKQLAQSIISEYEDLGCTLRGVKFKESTSYPGEDSLYMLRYPAEYGVMGIISEYCFIDNSEDQKWVMGNDKLDAEAQAIADGILGFFANYAY